MIVHSFEAKVEGSSRLILALGTKYPSSEGSDNDDH